MNHPSQSMLVAFLGGILIASSSPMKSIPFIIVALWSFLLSAEKKRLAFRIIKIDIVLLFMYTIGSVSISVPLATWISNGILNGLPVIVSVTFILSMVSHLGPEDIRIGIDVLLYRIPYVPSVHISFMAAMSYRFLLESAAILKHHREIFLFRRQNGHSVIASGKAFILSPLLQLLQKADELSQAYVFRFNNMKSKPVPFPKTGLRFWFAIGFLFAIKIFNIYTT